MRIDYLLVSSVSLFGHVQAWPWPPNLNIDGLKAARGIEGFLWRRQESDAPEATPTTSQRPTGSTRATITDGPSATVTGSSKSGASGSKTSGGGGNNRNSSSTTEFDPRLPAGGIQLLTPAAIAGEQYFKIGEWVTFAWNYTSLEATPTAVNVLASCQKNEATYTLALNQSVAETGRILWDTGEYQATATQSLLTSKYTLIVYDSDTKLGDAAKPGYLGSNSQYIFGMYTPQPYTPYSGYKCPTCNSAMTSAERMTVNCLIAMAGVTILSFTWFANSFNVI